MFSAAALADTDGFIGVHGVNWTVAAGTYYVAFEVRATDTNSGYVLHPSPTPLGIEAFTAGGTWIAYEPLNIGVRIDGTLAAVPEPASWALFITGFGLSGATLRRRRQAFA